MKDEIQKAPAKIITVHQSDDDILIRHFKGLLEREALSEALQRKAERIESCYELIKKYVSRLKVVPMMCNLIKNPDGTPISKATAYRIYDDTQRLFGETSVKNQSFWLDIELGNIEEDIAAARKLKDYRSVSALRKLKLDAIKNLMGSGDALLYEKFQIPPIEVGFFPRSKKVALPKDKELKKLVSDKMQEIAQDVDIEE